MKAVLHFDGGCRPTNPGHAAFGAVLEIEDGRVQEIGRYIGWKSNNVAEYSGLVVGLKMAHAHNVSFITVYTDSQLVVGHLTKGWKRNNDELKVLIGEAEKLLAGFDAWEIKWVKRHYNATADALCTAAILDVQNRNPWRARLGLRL